MTALGTYNVDVCRFRDEFFKLWQVRSVTRDKCGAAGKSGLGGSGSCRYAVFKRHNRQVDPIWKQLLL